MVEFLRAVKRVVHSLLKLLVEFHLGGNLGLGGRARSLGCDPLDQAEGDQSLDGRHHVRGREDGDVGNVFDVQDAVDAGMHKGILARDVVRPHIGIFDQLRDLLVRQRLPSLPHGASLARSIGFQPVQRLR